MGLSRPEYRKRFEKFQHAFGADRLEVWAYEASGFPEGCVVKDFAARIGIDASGIKVVRSNESISSEIVALTIDWMLPEALRRSPEADIRLRRRVVGLLSQGLPGKFRFSPDLVRQHIDAEDLDWLREQFGIDFTGQIESARHAPGDIEDQASLVAMRPRAMSGLRNALQERGLDAAGDDPHALLDRLAAWVQGRLD
ncbi:MAG: hypothetical protein KF887_16085 [Paracoccaceae bacterium]|nr:MAG: hypothetical protein KF887_16085 [Paracoccaceae bacterium]